MAEGNQEVRHRKGCRSRSGGRCNCGAGCRGKRLVEAEGKKIRGPSRESPRPRLATRRSGRRSRREGSGADRPRSEKRGTRGMRARKAGTIRNRSGDRISRRRCRGYEEGDAVAQCCPDLSPAPGLRTCCRIEIRSSWTACSPPALRPSTINVTLHPLRANLPSRPRSWRAGREPLLRPRGTRGPRRAANASPLPLKLSR